MSAVRGTTGRRDDAARARAEESSSSRQRSAIEIERSERARRERARSRRDARRRRASHLRETRGRVRAPSTAARNVLDERVIADAARRSAELRARRSVPARTAFCLPSSPPARVGAADAARRPSPTRVAAPQITGRAPACARVANGMLGQCFGDAKTRPRDGLISPKKRFAVFKFASVARRRAELS